MVAKQIIKEDFDSGKLNGKTYKQIFIFYGIKKASEKDMLRAVIEQLKDELFLGENGGKLYLFSDSGCKTGKVKCHERGYAFFIPDDKSGDLFIPAKNTTSGKT